MNLVCDESVDRPVVDRLRADGHSVVYIAETNAGFVDEDVLAQANALGAPLVTCDTDFGELVYRQRRANYGVLLMRLGGLSNNRKAEMVSEAVAAHSSEMIGMFTVVAPGHVRIRKAP